MNIIIKKIIIAALIILPVTGIDLYKRGAADSLFAGPADPVEIKIDQYMKKYKIAGLSYAVLKERTVVKTGFYGYSNIEQKVRTSKVTTYRIASISKTFTAMAVMKLWERKIINLNADISQYLGYRVRNPYFPRNKITVQMLLSHTSSLTDGGNYNSFLLDSYEKKTVHLSEILVPRGKYYSQHSWNRKAPGKYYQYSNLCYGILATIVERRSGMRFDLFCKKYFLDSLEMNASFNLNDLNFFDELAVLYYHQPPKPQQPAKEPAPLATAAAGDKKKTESAVKTHVVVTAAKTGHEKKPADTDSVRTLLHLDTIEKSGLDENNKEHDEKKSNKADKPDNTNPVKTETKLNPPWLNDFKPAYDRYPNGKQDIPSAKKYRVGSNAIIWGPQGGLRSSALGMTHFMRMFNYDGWFKNRQILQPYTLNYMTRVHASRKFSPSVIINKGLGFTVSRSLIPGRVLYGHSGCAFGLVSIMYMDKKNKSGIVILMNGGDFYKNQKYPFDFFNVELDFFRLLYYNYVLKR